MNDLKFALRQLLKHPGFTAVAVLTLALGIGANTAIFSFVNAILLKPLPYPHAERLVKLYESNLPENSRQNAVAPPMLGEWRKHTTLFDGLGAMGRENYALTGRGQAESLVGFRLSANLFSLLGIQPALGRDFFPDEETPGKNRVAILSHELWQSRFGGDSSVIGRGITLNAETYTIIGVMPPRTAFPENGAQIWTPLALRPDDLSQRHAHIFDVYGRLKHGVTIPQAQSEMDLVSGRLASANAENKGWGAEVYSYQEVLVSGSRQALLVLLGAVGLVLVIGCVNIASLLLARSSARAREFAIRAALGAGRGQVVRQLLTESMLLAVCGGLAGWFVAASGLRLVLRMAPADLPRHAEGITLDAQALGFTTLVTIVSGLLFGLAPALQSWKPSLARDLTDTARGSVSKRKQNMRGALVVAEVALSLMLLLGAGLLIRSFTRLMSKNLGFVPQHVITMQVSLPDRKYPESKDAARLFTQLHERVSALPGVESAGLVLGLPLGPNDMGMRVWIPEAPPAARGETTAAGYSQVSPKYFTTLKIPLLRGRDFSDQDREGTAPVVIVDEAFVRNFKLGTNVLGRQIRLGDRVGNGEIIGVVKDIRRERVDKSPRGEVYRPYQQLCWGTMSLVVRTQQNPADLTRAIRAELDQIDKDQPLEGIRTMTQLVSSSVAQRRLLTQLLGVFAAVALLLAAFGLYGLLAYTVTQRTREIGIRMALGARPGDVVRLTIQQGMKLSGLGIVLGLAGALAGARVLRQLLFEVEPLDPVSFGIASALLAGIAFLACWLPARRAARVDPMVALQAE